MHSLHEVIALGAELAAPYLELEGGTTYSRLDKWKSFLGTVATEAASVGNFPVPSWAK